MYAIRSDPQRNHLRSQKEYIFALLDVIVMNAAQAVEDRRSADPASTQSNAQMVCTIAPDRQIGQSVVCVAVVT